MFIFSLMKKRTKKIKTSIFAVQSSFYSLKRLNDSHRLTNLFYVRFNGLKLVCKSYVDSKIGCLKWVLNIEKGWRKCHMIWRRVSKSWKSWLKCFTVCVANDLKHWMTETNFDRWKSETRVFWLLFCSQKSDRKILQ